MEAVAKSHQNGVAHMDIKLNNILIDPDTMETKLIDFGYAASVSEIDNINQMLF